MGIRRPSPVGSYAKKGDNAALKAFAQKTLPVIQQHLDEAKKLPQ